MNVDIYGRRWSAFIYIYIKKNTPSHRGTFHFLLHLLLHQLVVLLLGNLDGFTRPVLRYERALEHNGTKEAYCRDMPVEDSQN